LVLSVLVNLFLQNGLVLDTSTQELMKRPHVLAVLATGEYTEEQVEEVFNRFGKLITHQKSRSGFDD